MNLSIPIRYHFMAYRREQLWLPAALWGIFLVIAVLFRQEVRAIEMTAAFLGVMLPLMAGVLATSALVDDPVLELQLAAPRRPWRSLLERLGILFGIVAIAALSYQLLLMALHIDISAFGSVFYVQLLWVVPSLAFMGLGTMAALAFTHGNAGVMFVGGIWIVQVMLRDWFVASPVGRYFFLFIGYIDPGNDNLLAIEGGLVGLAVVFIVISSLLLRREERYI